MGSAKCARLTQRWVRHAAERRVRQLLTLMIQRSQHADCIHDGHHSTPGYPQSFSSSASTSTGTGQGPTGGPTDKASPPPVPPSSSSSRLGIIAGVVVGSVALIALVGLVVFIVLRRRKQRQEELIRRRLVTENLSEIVEPYPDAMVATGHGNGGGSGSDIQMVERCVLLAASVRWSGCYD